jgi:hypothetical protein
MGHLKPVCSVEAPGRGAGTRLLASDATPGSVLSVVTRFGLVLRHLSRLVQLFIRHRPTGQMFKALFYGYNHATYVPRSKPWSLEEDANEQ